MKPNVPAILEYLTKSPDQTIALGIAIAGCCSETDIIALDGELGAGKTHLTRGLAIGLGIDPRSVSSPTFVMVQEYEPKSQASQSDSDALLLVHIDAYRLKGPDDLTSIGWDEDGRELRAGSVLAIEWAALIMPALGPDYLHVEIAHDTEGRCITITPRGGWVARLASLAQALEALGLRKVIAND